MRGHMQYGGRDTKIQKNKNNRLIILAIALYKLMQEGACPGEIHIDIRSEATKGAWPEAMNLVNRGRSPPPVMNQLPIQPRRWLNRLFIRRNFSHLRGWICRRFLTTGTSARG